MKRRAPKNKRMHGRPKVRESNRSFVLDDELRRMIRSEAKQLNLPEEAYLRLMTHFSEVVRTTVLPAGILDGGLLQSLLSNPLMMEMVKGFIRNMLAKVVNKNESGVPTVQTPEATVQTQPPRPPYGGGRWPGPQERPQWGGPPPGASTPGSGMMWGRPPMQPMMRQPQPEPQPQAAPPPSEESSGESGDLLGQLGQLGQLSKILNQFMNNS